MRPGHQRGRGSAAGGLRTSVPVVVGYLPAAVAFGVAAWGAGLSTVETVAMSLIVFSGASQFAIVGLVAAGTSWLVVAIIGLVLGVRHMLYAPPSPRTSGIWEQAGRLSPRLASPTRSSP